MSVGIENADVAELVDALASGVSGGNSVEVQVLSSAPCFLWAVSSVG